MELNIGPRIKRAWNAFFNRDPTPYRDMGYGHSYRPDRPRLSRGGEKSIVNSIYNRISLDASSFSLQHVKTDTDGRYLSTYVNSELNQRFNSHANKDQTGRAFLQDAVLSLLDEGVIGIVPIDLSDNPYLTSSVDILSMRVGEILEWRPDDVYVRVYNDKTGQKENMWFPKSFVTIIENPFYTIMNEPNSTMQRLIHKYSMLDAIDEQSSSGKLDIIIQVPYTVKSPARKKYAQERRQEIADQLENSKYGIAYIDSTEHVIQLNRAVENNLLKQIENLTNEVFSQLGMTLEILNGTADEKTMQNYYVRIIEPILSAIVDGMKWKFLTKTARSQGQSIMFFRDPFKLIPLNALGDIVNSLERNEVVTTNEIRQGIGMKPSTDPKADRLENSNMPRTGSEINTDKKEETNQNGNSEMGF